MSRKRSRKGQQSASRPQADPGPTLVVTPHGSDDHNTPSPPTGQSAVPAEQTAIAKQGPAPAANSALEPGTLITDDYRVMEVLERDAVAISYKAEDINLGVAVLLKEFAPAAFVERVNDGTLRPRSEGQGDGYQHARARFLHEAQTLVHFRHPNIVRAHRMFETNNTVYIVLDYEQGEPFDVWLAELGRAPSQVELDRLLAPLLSALGSVHDSGYLHGDLCPGSVLVRPEGGPALVHFANAWRMGHGDTAAIQGIDPTFAAPEVQDKDVQRCGPWSDLYAIAALLYLAIKGKTPAEDAGQPASAAGGDYRQEFLEAIDQALAAEIERRPQSLDDWTGINPPGNPDPTALTGTGSAPTLVNDPTDDPGKTLIAPAASGKPTKGTALSQLATRVISALPEIKEETDIPQQDFERWVLPLAIAAGILGAVLFATGLNFALAAVCQVAATVLFFLRGYMPLARFLSHTTRQSDAIIRRAEQATTTAAWMIAAILALMTVNPIFVGRFIPPNSEAPVAMLAAIIAVPALIMMVCGYVGMSARGTIARLVAGAANMLVVIFSALLLAGFVFTTLSTPENTSIHPSVQVNRYLYIIATLASGTLGILIFLSRLSARQRAKQAAMS